MRRRILIAIVCSSTILLAYSCKSKRGILPVNEMKVVMWDMLLADNWYAQTAIRDTTAQKNKKYIALYESVFKQDGVTKEQFYKSYNYYQTHTKEMVILLDSLEAYGSRAKGISEAKSIAEPIKPIKPSISQLIKAAK